MNLQQQQQNASSYENSRYKRDMDKRLANGLGWFSVGLGLAEVIAPRKIAHLTGVPDKDKNRSLLRLYGLRELAAGVAILSQPQSPRWLWGRVAGDLVDLAELASAMNSRGSEKTRVVTATAAVLGVTALDVLCARRLSEKSSSNGRQEASGYSPVAETITVNRSPEEVYNFWHDFERLPTFMRYLESVRVTGDRRSHWRAKGPGGGVEWDAEITDDTPNEMISWRSLEGSDVDNTGTVRFQSASGGRGTVVRVELRYAPPGGAVGAAIAKLFATDPGHRIHDDLRAFKQIMETGEVVKSDASIHSGMHPAQPAPSY
jgi:uncharacterized membrane protein